MYTLKKITNFAGVYHVKKCFPEVKRADSILKHEDYITVMIIIPVMIIPVILSKLI